MLLKGKSVAVIGGGPVGLLMARLLQSRNVEVKVYERDAHEHARKPGGTLDLGDEFGAKVMDEAGLLDDFRKYSREVGDRAYDKNGIFIEEIAFGSLSQVDRKDLRRVLINSLDPDTIVWGKQYSSAVRNDSGTYEISFKDDTKVTVDVLIAADGRGSKVRSLVSSVEPTYTGITIVKGEIENFSDKCPEMWAMVQPPGSGSLNCLPIEAMVLFLQPRAHNVMDWYMATAVPEDWSKDKSQFDITSRECVESWCRDKLCDWCPAYHTLIDATSGFEAYPQYRLFTNGEKWHTYEGVALIGDAAHVMPPFAGTGMNVGFVDALRLFHNLTNDPPAFDSIGDAVRNYAEDMYGRAHVAQEETEGFANKMTMF